MDWLTSQRTKGRDIFLYNDTGRNLKLPKELENLFSGIFTDDLSSSSAGSSSQEFSGTFTYVGAAAHAQAFDERATKSVLVGSEAEIDLTAKTHRKEIEARFVTPGPTVKDWLQSLRLHHWTKNLLLFIPFFLDQSWHTPLVSIRQRAIAAVWPRTTAKAAARCRALAGLS